jgi:hypothetical protein
MGVPDVFLGTLDLLSDRFTIKQNLFSVASGATVFPIVANQTSNTLFVQTFVFAGFVNVGDKYGCIPFPLNVTQIYGTAGADTSTVAALSSTWATERGCFGVTALNATTAFLTSSIGSVSLTCITSWQFAPTAAGPHAVSEVCVSAGVTTRTSYAVSVIASARNEHNIVQTSALLWTPSNNSGTPWVQTRGCGYSITNTSWMLLSWMSPEMQCVSISATASSFTAPARQFFGNNDVPNVAQSTLCVATVNLYSAPLSYRLRCGTDPAMYAGALLLSPSSGAFTLFQNLQNQSIAPLPVTNLTASASTNRTVVRRFVMHGCQPTTPPPPTTAPPTVAPTRAPEVKVAVKLKMNIDVATASTPAFKRSVRSTVAKALNISESRVEIGAVTAGSALVTIVILPDPDAPAATTNPTNPSISSNSSSLSDSLSVTQLAAKLIVLASSSNNTLTSSLPVDTTYTPTTTVLSKCWDDSYQASCPPAPTPAPTPAAGTPEIPYVPIVIGVGAAIVIVAIGGLVYYCWSRRQASADMRKKFYQSYLPSTIDESSI